MKPNLIVVHGGGPTAVINGSLYGVVDEALKSKEIGRVYGAIGGTQGILDENFIDFSLVDRKNIDLLPFTPGSAIGTSRFPLLEEQYKKMIDIFRKYNIRYILFNGGNGTMDTCGKLYKLVDDDMKVIGIPKTVDNDISITDHCPGFGSAARYMAHSVKELSEDVRSLPIHVSIIEAMGRNAGWIAAASALARDEDGNGPDLIYLPERPFSEVNFLADVEKLYKEKGGVVVVVSEGLIDKDGYTIVPPIFETGRATYFGDVSSYLAGIIIKELGVKARSEKPGLLGRASISLQSRVDREEAIEAGRAGVRAAINGHTGVMVGFKRISNMPYKVETMLIPIEEVMIYEKTLDEKFINKESNGITREFIDWCRPLIGGNLPDFAKLI